MKKKPAALVSFVGLNDRGDEPKKGEGAILAVFEERKFDKVYLLWVNTPKQTIDFHAIAENVQSKLQRRKLCKEVEVIQFACTNVVDHNEIYTNLLKFCADLPASYNYTAAISSGTPQMQACWLLLAESGDFKIELIRTNEKIFGGERVEPVKLNSALPRITSLRKEVQKLIPNLTIDLQTGIVSAGDIPIRLAPTEFSHYCVLANSAKQGAKPYHFNEEDIPQEMADDARSYLDQTFPQKIDLLTRKELEDRKHQPVHLTTWRSYVSTINAAFKNSALDPAIAKYFQVTIEGKRFSYLYSIKASSKKICFIR